MTQRFAGKVAIVTGGGAGIGRAIVDEWVRDGGSVTICDMDLHAAEKAAAEVAAAGGQALALEMDVNKLEAVAGMVPATVKRFGGLDVLFNVAGNNMMKNVEEANDEEWHFIVDTNLTSVYRCSHVAIPEIKKRGGGVIINIASTAGILAENRCAAYSAAKAAVINLSKNMAMDFARHNIRVNAICPGGTWTPRIRGYMARFPEHQKMMTDVCAMERMAEPHEIAKPAVFLASDDASFITGAALVVDGGMTAGKRFELFDSI
ncbi:MAG: SDR family NAD(P)-dependent oxidoreductase [Immundisolibacter sp.]|uniref:SDR family NAD(P)-dependent oxidoreductase n=1 Tax=Immundisolibacter sp. TaxID=1934948 RepID=UPI003EDEB1B7